MKLFTKLFLALGFAGSLAAGGVALAAEAPDAVVKKAVDGVTSAINADKSIQSGDRGKIMALVDTKVVPYVNVERMTQSAVGPNWAKATPEQKAQLQKEFKHLLTNTYAGAFASYRPDTQIEYKPMRGTPGATDTAVVRSVVTSGTAQPIPIDYYLEQFNGEWKVVDFSVYNARLVELYKGQFNAAIAANGVDGLIKQLAAKNGSVAATPAKS